VVIDLGTGDGRGVLALAAREPASFVLGVDANAASLAESSRRAARPPRKGGLPNVLFVASAVEGLPRELDGAADLVTIQFPWGSLLRGVLGLDAAASAAIARPPKAGGLIRALVSVTERDGIPEVPALDAFGVTEVALRLAPCGLAVAAAREATALDLAASRSTWAKRLRTNPARPVWLLELRRLDASASSRP
jgi:16S rRNA (adenine(1408)-N(1))-methyltransferase